jgi:hypothetical protein
MLADGNHQVLLLLLKDLVRANAVAMIGLLIRYVLFVSDLTSRGFVIYTTISNQVQHKTRKLRS